MIMWCEIFVRLLLAHVMGDFLFQTQKWCDVKLKSGFRCRELYFHSGIILILSWIALWSWYAWWIAVIIGVIHLLIDAVKKTNSLFTFVIDQAVHVVCLIVMAYVAVIFFKKGMPYCNVPLKANIILYALVFLLNAKPSNILIKHLLDAYSVKSEGFGENKKENKDEIQSGKLIGNIERWLIVIFIICGQYDAIGFLIAAKSIIRYKEGDTGKTEYVLAGTLISVFIAVISGMLLKL